MIDVCYCGNYGIFKGIFLSALSLAKSTSEPLSIHLLTADITYIKDGYNPLDEKQRAYLEEVLKGFNPESSVTLHDASIAFEETFALGRNMRSMYTPFAFLRLLMDEIEGLPDKILYLDVDTIVLKDVSSLYNTDLRGKDIGVVNDGIREKGYFNSGVMLFDLAQIKKDGSFKATREYLFTHKLMMPDQDALNYIYKNNKVLLPAKYNDQRAVHRDTVIRHYCQSIRVWPYFHIIKAKPWEEKFLKAYPKEAPLELINEYRALYNKFLKL